MHKNRRKSKRMDVQQMADRSYLGDVLVKVEGRSSSRLILYMSVLFDFVIASICYLRNLFS